MTAKSITGEIVSTIFHNVETGFSINKFEPMGQRPITILGEVGRHDPGTWLTVKGSWQKDRKFGLQFKVEDFKIVIPHSRSGMVKFLSSGFLNGIGPATAEAIVDKFGDNTYDIFDNQPERLREISGIGATRAKQIGAAWKKHGEMSASMTFLQGYGLGPGLAYRIVKKYKEETEEKVREDPYRLCREFWGVGFKTADQIALNMGLKVDAPLRIKEVIDYVLNEGVGDGHIYLTKRKLMTSSFKFLEPYKPDLSVPIETLVEENRIVIDGDKFYTRKMWYSETGVSKQVGRIFKECPDKHEVKEKPEIDGVELSKEQQSAVELVFSRAIVIITGGPGTGKTTMVKAIVNEARKAKKHFSLAAPTGRAAKKLSEATGRRASTIHRLLQYVPETGGFAHGRDNPLSDDLIIIDEVSMVDIYLMHSLIKAVKSGARLVLVGDFDQLPSVGPGAVLESFIESRVIPMVRLTKIYRQAAKSAIVRCSYEILKGKPISDGEGENGDFFFIHRSDPEKILETVTQLVVNNIPTKYKFNPLTEIQVLVPKHKGTIGTENFNKALQQVLNPKGYPFERAGKEWRVGDKVMQTKNNYKLDVFNGDMGTILSVDLAAKEITIDYDGRPLVRAIKEMNEMAPAYAITIHKSQGSEYPAVVVPIHSQYSIMLQRNLIYTAVTRAKQLVVMVGTRDALHLAIKNSFKVKRNTALAERISEQLKS